MKGGGEQEWGEAFSDERMSSLSQREDALPRVGKGELYFTGPIPMNWVEVAAKLGGRAFHLACALWFEAKLQKTATIRPSAKTLASFGLTSRQTFYRALDALVRAKLVRVRQEKGQRPIVTILEKT